MAIRLRPASRSAATGDDVGAAVRGAIPPSHPIRRGLPAPGTIASAVAALLLALCLGSAPMTASAHSTDYYSHDDNAKVSNPDWMTQLGDNVKLNQLALPGTHESVSFHGGDAVRTQTMSLEDQLESGIRVLDVRCYHALDHCRIHHGSIDQERWLEDVFETLKRFLSAHRGEAVLMRVRFEGAADFPPFTPTRTWEETWKTAYQGVYKDLIWDRQHSADPNVPTLGEVRGKIVILVDFAVDKGSSKLNYGLDYADKNIFKIQDDWKFTTNWDLYDKWEKVRQHFIDANKESNADKWYINYLSGSFGSFPYFVASGHSSPGTGAPRLATGRTTPGWSSWPDFPRVDCASFLGLFDICTIAFEGINILYTERLLEHGISTLKTAGGIVMADFPGPALIQRTIDRNYTFRNLSVVVKIQGDGWKLCYSSDWCGTRDKSLRLESIRIEPSGMRAGMSLRYRCYVENTGFTPWIGQGVACLPAGQYRRVEGIEIELDNDSVKAGWHIVYQGFIQDKGEVTSTRDGGYLGTVHESRRLEEIRVWLEKD